MNFTYLWKANVKKHTCWTLPCQTTTLVLTCTNSQIAYAFKEKNFIQVTFLSLEIRYPYYETDKLIWEAGMPRDLARGVKDRLKTEPN